MMCDEDETLLECAICGAIFADPLTKEVVCPYCGVSHYREVEVHRLDGSTVVPHGPSKEKAQ